LATDAEQAKAEETTGEERWDSQELARRIAAWADDKRARDIVLMHVTEALQVTDWFVIATARNRRHLSVIAETVAKELKQHGIHRLAGTPFKDENWVVLDFGSVVLHVFSPHAREYYDLENLWGDCERIAFEPQAPEEA
jgi:ribosome-associated protein